MLTVVLLFAVAALITGATPGPAGDAASPKAWDPWNYGAASQCVLRELGDVANAQVTSALVGKSTIGLQPVFDECSKRSGLEGRPYEAQQLLNAVVATSYVKAAECASAELAYLRVEDFDRELKSLKGNPAGYQLPADIRRSVAACNSEMFGWYAAKSDVHHQVLTTLRYARKWRDQLAEWKNNKRLRTPEGQLALCIVEKNMDGAVSLISRVQGAHDVAQGRIMASNLLPDVASPCVRPYPSSLATDKLMTHIVNFFLVSLGKQRVRG